MISFTIPYPPTKRGKSAWNRRYGLNSYYAGKHYQARKREAEELHALSIGAIKVVDAMKGYILPWVRKVSHEFWDGGEIQVEVCPWKTC